MTRLVDPSEIERIVGIKRHPLWHYARAVTAERTVYIMHSAGPLTVEKVHEHYWIEVTSFGDRDIQQLCAGCGTWRETPR
jgi:hypothetical protein